MKIEVVNPTDDHERGELNTRHQRLFEMAQASVQGAPEWIARKEFEARRLFLLSQRAPSERLTVLSLDMRETIRVEIALRVPVGCLPNPSGSLWVADHAVLGILYPREVLTLPLPGYALVTLLDPQHAWYPNVWMDRPQQLCLGDHIPVNISLEEIVLQCYGLLSMQSVMVDERDSAGVMNREAAQWWQRNLKYVPLTKTAFFAAE